jgi:radical SAM protein with 4Fe4S-binding SPASM domain
MDSCEYFPEPQNAYEAFIIDKYLKKIRPNTIHFELTERCNLRCIHCLYPKISNDELSTEEIYGILLQLKEIGVFNLALSGGEIFVRKDIQKILDFLLEHRFLLAIYTNGTLLTRSLIEKIAALNPTSVEISVYGATPEIHDRITTVPGSFQKTISTIQAFNDCGVNVIFKGFLLRDNFHQRWEMIALAHKIGVLYVFDFNLIPMVNGEKSNIWSGLTIEQIRKMYHEVAEDGLILRNNVALKSRESQLPQGGKVICNPGVINGCIGPNGEVFPCPVLRKPMGNLREKSLEDIWKTDKIDDIRYMKLEDLDSCPDCLLLEYCNRCPGVAYLETGDYLGPAPLSVCSKYKALVVIHEGSDAI